MKLLVTGRGTSGSFQIRGQQLGHAIGADVMLDAAHFEGYHLAILVKRSTGNLLDRLHGARVPIIYDVLDGWPQGDGGHGGNDWDRRACIDWLGVQIRQINPAALVAATDAMRRDCEGFGLPVLWLPHHARPSQAINPIRQDVRTVAYEGSVQYLGKWRSIMERECKARGWKFVVNPVQLADADIVVAVREAEGYAPRKWKSNVKLANAQGSGTPCIMNTEEGYIETDNGAVVWADTAQEMKNALDSLTPYEARTTASVRLLEATLTLQRTANEYLQWLRGLLKS